MSTRVPFLAPILMSVVIARPADQMPLDPAEGVYEAGAWRYQLVVLDEALPSRRAVGKLTYRGKEVLGIAFARITTDLGQFQWAGYGCDWVHVGWYRIDPETKYSRWIRVRIDEAKNGPVRTVAVEGAGMGSAAEPLDRSECAQSAGSIHVGAVALDVCFVSRQLLRMSPLRHADEFGGRRS
jgi:hypothetical protein